LRRRYFTVAQDSDVWEGDEPKLDYKRVHLSSKVGRGRLLIAQGDREEENPARGWRIAVRSERRGETRTLAATIFTDGPRRRRPRRRESCVKRYTEGFALR